MTTPRQFRFERSGPLAIRPSALFEFFVAPISRANTQEADGAVQIVSVKGPLSQEPDPDCDDYAAIRERVQEALTAPSSRAVMLRINSPGGALYGCLDMARAIRADALEAGKPLVAFIEGDGCSAAYALACAADSIILATSTVVGSIGVIEPRLDASQAEAARGYATFFITSGNKKAYGRPELKMSDAEYESSLQLIAGLAQPFIEWVSERRALSIDIVAGYEAGVFTGPAALQVRLADRAMSFDAVVASLATGAIGITMKMSEIVAALQLAAASEDPGEQAGALKMLAAMTAEDESEDPKAEDEKEEPKAEDKSDDKSDDEPDGDEAKPFKKAAAATHQVSAETAQDLAAQLSTVTERLAKVEHDRDAEKVSMLLKGQPKALQDALRGKPLSDVQKIVSALPKPGRVPPVTTVTSAEGTPAKGASKIPSSINPQLKDHIERQLRRNVPKKTATRMINGRLYFDVPEDFVPSEGN